MNQFDLVVLSMLNLIFYLCCK